jgi:NAD(P)-dependent dehydrogenase (short-subunit alcohol dehydrogenase family)
MSLSNLALITGGAKNIGATITRFLHKYNYKVIIHYNQSADEALALKDQLGSKSFLLKADLTKISEAKKLSEEILKHFPDCNLLINNASIFNKSQFIGNDDIENKNMNIHYHAPMILTKAIYKNCQKSKQLGNVINIIDKNVNRNSTKYFYYLLSKKMLAEFTKLSAAELAPLVRVNAVSPGTIKKKDHLNYHSQEELTNIIKKIPLNRVGKQEEITQAIDFILSNQFVVGQNICIDGGASLNDAG